MIWSWNFAVEVISHRRRHSSVLELEIGDVKEARTDGGDLRYDDVGVDL